MKKHHRKSWGWAVQLPILAASSMLATAQVPQVTITAPSNISNPLLLLQDFSGDTGVVPLFELVGGLSAKTVGIEVTSQSGSTASVPPNLGTIMGTGFGGLSLVQTNGAAMGAGASSPFLSMCAQQFDSTNGTGAACWSWQVQGMSGSDPPDVLKLTRNNATNPTQDITVLFPAMINLATAPTGAGIAGQITVGPAPISGPNANVPSTFTGAGTSDTTSSATAGPVTVEPGQLLGNGPASGAVEGALQILQSYLGSNGTMNANVGRLACPDATIPTPIPQTVKPCATTGQAENWVGVYNLIPGQASMIGGSSITPLRYGRVPVQSASPATWLGGDFICKDDANASYVLDNGGTPCNAGESIGVSVGDPSSGTLHVVDLIPEASVQGGAVMTFFCTGGVASHMTVFMWPGSGNTNCAQTASTIEQPVSFSGTIRNLAVFYGTAPGGALTDNITVVKCHPVGTCTPTAVTCPITGSSQTCVDNTHSVAVLQGDGIQVQDATATLSGGKDVRISIQIQ